MHSFRPEESIYFHRTGEMEAAVLLECPWTETEEQTVLRRQENH